MNIQRFVYRLMRIINRNNTNNNEKRQFEFDIVIEGTLFQHKDMEKSTPKSLDGE